MKKSRLSTRWARGIIRRRSFDQVNSHLIMEIYIHTADHAADNGAICSSLLLESQPFSWQEADVLYTTEAAINSDRQWRFQALTATMINRVEQQILRLPLEGQQSKQQRQS